MGNKGKVKFFHYLNTRIELVISENSMHSYPLHNHVSVFIIGMVLNGEIKLKIAEKSYNYKLRQFFVIPPYISHGIEADKSYSLLSICINKNLLREKGITGIQKLLDLILKNILESEKIDSEEIDLLLNSLKVLEKYINIDGEKDVHLEKVREYIEIYPENIFSIDEMADSAFSSKYNFIRRFKERTGLTPHQFQIQNRIRKAQKLLEKLSITTEVALTTGFYDQSHFIRNFKKIVKMTPLEFQSSIKRINLFKEELE
ncbi:helix-turn-helix domain-containing protein [Fusobacterium ulcerans]|uniref:helix-turn-helix domain-containing protein n=1 Tax=Fusobacterium ulcerans TaxID=861 RepID=UPI002E790AC6|nr:helix-turn-helix domain-containing protein [Fusobacterium ulcerans]MEE0138216.1 helix-turn-helix domain-containing protein [Fusobacterium ulcerans]